MIGVTNDEMVFIGSLEKTTAKKKKRADIQYRRRKEKKND